MQTSMRVVLHNPHVSPWYKIGVGDVYNRVRSVQKYSYIFDYLYKNNAKVYVYIDNIATSLSWGIIEFWLWVIINKLNPFKFRVIGDLQKLTSKDVFITFLYRNLTTINGKISRENRDFIDRLSTCNAYKVAQLSHYGYHTSLGSKNAEQAKIDLFISESNLAKNSDYFRYHYNWYKKDVYVMPFVPKERFQVKTNYHTRNKKALAMGTLTYPIEDKDFTSFFKSGILQPMRQEIYTHSKQIDTICDSYISDANEHRKTNSTQRIKSNKYRNYIQSVCWGIKKQARLALYIARIYFTRKTQTSYKGDREYMNFDVVNLYNKYTMFVNPEEVIGLPGIGFVEGMACGCAYIGLQSPMYSDIGMIEGVHYIGYNGTLNDLCAKISYYQENENKLAEIANNGNTFIQQKNNPTIIMERFLQFLLSEIQNR